MSPEAGDIRSPALRAAERPLLHKLACEGIATALLLVAIVGSGIMAERLSAGNDALALLANSIATGGALLALIVTFGPESGAHINPAVTLGAALQREMRWSGALLYIGAQLLGGILGVILAHAMFELPLLQASQHARWGTGQWIAEAVATFGLLVVIAGSRRQGGLTVAFAVAAYITGAYWFTASTSFANPAVTVARSLSDTFAGIAPGDAPAFIAAQIVGLLVALPLLSRLGRGE